MKGKSQALTSPNSAQSSMMTERRLLAGLPGQSSKQVGFKLCNAQHSHALSFALHCWRRPNISFEHEFNLIRSFDSQTSWGKGFGFLYDPYSLLADTRLSNITNTNGYLFLASAIIVNLLHNTLTVITCAPTLLCKLAPLNWFFLLGDFAGLQLLNRGNKYGLRDDNMKWYYIFQHIIIQSWKEHG